PFSGNQPPFPNTSPAPAAHRIRLSVVTPEGTPAAGAHVEVYLGRPVHVSFEADGKSESDGKMKVTVLPEIMKPWIELNGSGVSPQAQPERISVSTGDDGTGELSVPGQDSGWKLIVLHESGYSISPVRAPDSEGSTEIALQPWGIAEGVVSFNATPVKAGRLLAGWESFPFHPQMLGLPAEELLKGPPLVSVTQSVEIIDGHLRVTKVPPGRVRLSAAASSAASSTDRDASGNEAPTFGNVTWWEDARSAAATEPAFLPDRQTTRDFDVITVRGRLKLTDKLYERRVYVEQTPNGHEVRQADLQVTFVKKEFEGWAFDQAADITQAIRVAAVWGRPGGKRESMPNMSAAAKVCSDGTFEQTLLRGHYTVNLLIRRHDSPDGRMTLEHVASDVAAVEAPAEGDMTVDLGEVDVDTFTTVPNSYSLTPIPDPGLPTNQAAAPPLRRGAVNDSVTFERPGSVYTAPDASRRPVRDDFNSLPVFSSPVGNTRSADSVAEPAVSEVDRAIAKLVTDLLAAGDRRTRENLRTPLQELLEKKFEAEQQARETLVQQLTERLEEAARQVRERSAKKDQIVREQLNRMMGLPEDTFLPMNPPDIAPEKKPEPDAPALFRAS
ncbi:MAG: hypothetical protein KDA89_15935, partial [Planctomycetaceae bacterium]|nr:hypothetical protein [Planctomycetaceae bacterium]